MSDNTRRKFLKATGATITTVSLAGCGGDGGDGGDGGTSGDGGTGTGGDGGTTGTSTGGGGSGSLQKVGMTAYVRGGAWITAYIEAARFYAEDQGIQLDVRPNQQSAQKQVQDIREFANGDYDGILVGVWQTGAAEGAINQAIEGGTPVFATNADTSSSEIPLYVGFSNYDGGASSAEQMVKALESQYPDKDTWRVLNVRGVQGNQSANQRSQGFLDVMSENDRVEVVQTLNGEYARDVAQRTVQEWINSNGRVDGIYSGNLSMGLGVVQAVRNLDMLVPKGEEGHICLTQMDGSPEVNPLVGDGTIDAAVDQPNYFYNPIALKYMKMYVEAGNDQSVIPEVESEVTSDQFSVETGNHKGVEMWSEPIWEPGIMREQNGHPWFRTNSVVITQENYDEPYLWGNIWG
ncbi:sugar ABC transporter substrate-binding protein [Haloarcula amylovorans]|uniref:sugar ABC transporter substrate-binding protein n=1 Tax=Haloarcula amylovorans TaxID=2562280 RepID=UPI00107648A9|nr:sugar ABC transporter substrate-binding protein [Halomicroarcula amylolytica]